MGRMFGTDGIRGVANVELTPEIALKTGRAVAALLKEQQGSSRPCFVIGMDTRVSGKMLESALVAGITSAGVDVHLLGVISTPGVSFLIRHMKAAGGVMVSASHNSFQDNGLKFFNNLGHKLNSELEEEVERHYFQEADFMPRPSGKEIGRSYHGENAVEHYLSFLEGCAPPLRGIKVVLDCANGSLYHIAPSLLKQLGAEVTLLSGNPDGLNINVGCGSTNPAVLQETVRKVGAHAGLAFDGDGDRLIAVDEKGELVDGDAILAICGIHMKEKGLLTGDTVVATVMSNGGLEMVAREKGFQVLRTRVGDRYVLEKMLKGGYVLGGEQSGHVIFSHLLPTGDGLLTALQLLKVMVEKGVPLSELAGVMPRFPQILVNCPVREKDGWQENPRLAAALEQARKRLGTWGRVLVRASGTEPLIRIMVEGENYDLLHELSSELALMIGEELGQEKQ
ncbi:MAG: phosphoglucosamine mutase [Dethiobacteria bacterium]|jgi:phosphoglucosamine mutase